MYDMIRLISMYTTIFTKNFNYYHSYFSKYFYNIQIVQYHKQIKLLESNLKRGHVCYPSFTFHKSSKTICNKKSATNACGTCLRK